MKKSQIIKNFNTIISEFLEQIAPNIGHTYFHSFSLLIKINCTEPIQQFIKYIHNSEEPLAEYINTKNEAYFQNTDNHKEYINTIDNSNMILFEIIKLQDTYSKLDMESKDNFWDILQALLQLSNEYLKAKS
jgi:hypothetical protein